MAVRIRMKKMGKKHRQFFRICAVDRRAPRDGKVLEELGTYDPHVAETDARTILKTDRVAYWLGVGAEPSEKVAVLIKKYGPDGTHIEAQKSALDRVAMAPEIPHPGEPASKPKSKEEVAAEQAAAEAPAEAAPAEGAAEQASTEGEETKQAAEQPAEAAAE
ncbi:30S ribosomal protein S16 [Pirellulimonas nuda]|uniref:Small ribosomal subunit protein bS16 n=1 Tax=Pirellulimonas nuda TaxID=2528009 RepID=A0A518DHC7_9BACT|nr:30S ribosomal protein S16 [Pirellulimonas nuda]QDU90880.1 30S ribosomal protein S16 [Pirellulimonas nuda]